MSHKVVSIVLGGGRGTRLYPLTEQRSKPAVPIAGKYRLVDIPISNCLNSGYNKIFVLTQYNSASLNKHIKNAYNFSIFSKGFVDILAADQNNEGDRWFEGTADAVRRTQKNLLNVDYDYVLILSGDQLYQMDYAALVDFHVKNKGDVTIATIPVTGKDATGFGILKSDENNVITSFIEKPNKEELLNWGSEVSEEMDKRGRHYLASMGIYVFSKGVLASLLKENPGMDFGKEIIPESIDSKNVLSYQFDGYWTDIGTISSFFEANIGLTDDIPDFNLFNETVYTRARMLPPSKISGTTLNNTIVADGCILNGDKIQRSIIGIRSRIGHGTVIKNTYMMGSDYYEQLEEVLELGSTQAPPPVGVGERCYIENAILDKNCRIGNNVRIKGGKHLKDGDYETYAVCDGIVVVKKEAVIVNGITIGC
ncbi:MULTISPECIES: glucose-1-phosphate adenylyltransferase [Sphingobacterium]|jgi:glucose-1-phosphate adenylyltransferase|uniref:Glucose-1-phosphate adenylyltransferase n=2 Tax=Sphingobacterium TaxID=28453 RepID=A0ABW5YXQ7_9SPHI|nr:MULTISPECIES: glucose-1-phosphate adenylyltransferase [Sphingobacterium]KKX48502.1 glucose-1-phosphate adenylyltransferase [Sphingobacterium sp. IITKGP-BTPF85]MBB2952100.1 glucose-1-phosphate adenylyltransferase [Sphingobacterium sp. JUb56]MCS3553893.1 glucose-1-phosphate adenylyltransferase [Sphingobacterium sp. JUb21]MCW2260557.1 glucose-1-phosphate adenylyltransferase [Sphingobacterium kitahiroshimense]NJI75935.1 glucose-1-phosphate adenylyltransferase [Sphingobacterium sp. B16(2022)]